ncbi:MAG: thioredoxin [Candidatus Neomarinimicrobiota bacterium]
MNTCTVDSRDLESIQFGHGKLELEVFLEPTCPFSKRAFTKLQPLLSAVGEDQLTIKIRFLSQPWHLFSAVVTRCILAATATEGAQEAGLKVMNAVFENREDFVCQDHCSGPNMTRSPTDILNYISQLNGVDLSAAFELDSVTRAVKWHAKYCRQNGVHSSPSFAINGLVNDAMGSGQSIEEWAELLGLIIEA